MFYGHTTFIERIEMFTFPGLSLSRPVDTKLTSIWTTLYRLCLSFSSEKYSPANFSAYILNLVSFSLFDQRDSDKTEKINIRSFRAWLPVRNRQRCRSAANWLQKALQKSCEVGRCSIAKFWLLKCCHGQPFASDKKRFGSGAKNAKKR